MKTAHPATVLAVKRHYGKSGAFELFELLVDGQGDPDEHRGAGTGRPDPVDIVLVHGLTGDALATWGGEVDSEGRVSECWPAKLCRELGKGARVWAAGYSAPLFESQLGISGEAFREEGCQALDTLVEAGMATRRRIIFVAHSLGGLLVKSLLVSALAADEFSSRRSVVANTSAVLFVGTPHRGSDHARWRFAVPLIIRSTVSAAGKWALAAIAGLGLLVPVGAAGGSIPWPASAAWAFCVALVAMGLLYLARPGRHLLYLDPDNQELHNLNNDYRRVVASYPFAHEAFFEQKPLLFFFTIVPRGSADPSITDCHPQGIRANHVAMCKDPHAHDIVKAIRRQVAETRLGHDKAVFGELLMNALWRVKDRDLCLKPFINEKEGAFLPKFKCVPVDGQQRVELEEALRGKLRHLVGSSRLQPTQLQLADALASNFDIDKLVWEIWHERLVAQILRALRECAKREMASWPADSGPESLFALFRPLRTIEHAFMGDLASSGTTTDRELLVRAVDAAEVQLERRCQSSSVDGDGRTRRLLLRMRCCMDAMDIAFKFIGNSKPQHNDPARVVRDLPEKRARFKEALKKFRDALDQPIERST
jgi:hypothetical protein